MLYWGNIAPLGHVSGFVWHAEPATSDRLPAVPTSDFVAITMSEFLVMSLPRVPSNVVCVACLRGGLREKHRGVRVSLSLKLAKLQVGFGAAVLHRPQQPRSPHPSVLAKFFLRGRALPGTSTLSVGRLARSGPPRCPGPISDRINHDGHVASGS